MWEIDSMSRDPGKWLHSFNLNETSQKVAFKENGELWPADSERVLSKPLIMIHKNALDYEIYTNEFDPWSKEFIHKCHGYVHCVF